MSASSRAEFIGVDQAPAEASPRAWDDPATIASWRRTRRMGRVWLAIGVVAFVAAMVAITRTADLRDRLIDSGVETTGIVLADPADTLRCGQVPVPIRFRAAGRTRVHDFFVSGCGGDGLARGDRVSVVYDPDDPSDFVVDGEANERPLPLLLQLTGLLAGTGLICGWAIRGRRLHRLRSLLTRHAWREHTADVAPLRTHWTTGRSVVALLDEPVLVLTQAAADVDPSIGATIVAAGDGPDPYVIDARRSTGRSKLVLATRPVTERGRKKAEASLAAWRAINR
jgi:hypothetical protein